MATGIGEWQGNTLTTGVSGAYRYVKITNAVFNTTTGVTTITFDIGTYCSYGNFQGSNFTSTGSFTDSYQVYGPDIYGLHANLTETVAHNATRHFTEGCYYYSSSQGQLLESNLDFVWQPTLPTYAVSYNANGGQGAPTSQTKSWGETLTLTSTAPTRAGYTFGGWNTSADGTGTSYAAGASYTANANATLYAQWTLNTWSVSYNANGGSGSVASQTKQYNVPLVLASSGFAKSYYTLDGWATSATGGVAYALGATYTGNAALSLYAHWKVNAPATPTGISATRNTDAKATISWTRATGADTTYTRIYVERSADGGTFEVLGAISGTSTSYADTTIAANHAYTYRVRAWNSTGYSSYATASAIYTTPAAPASLTGERTGGGTSVLLTVGNDGTRNATGFDVQSRAADSATWTDATVASSTGTPVATITIDNMGGSYYFRVRNTRGTLASAWTESGLIVTITPPNAPTLVNPSSGAVISASGATQAVTFAWQHNPIDGSAQTAAQVRYRKSTVSAWTTASASTAQTLSATLDEGYTYVWQARTKGAADDYGPWSNTQSFDLYSPPVVTITQPSGTVVGMPLAYAISYNDAHGVFASGSVAIKLNGATIYSEQLPATATTIGAASTITGEITTAEFLPTSGTSYTIEFSVRSSDTLTATVSQAMPVNMGEPTHGELDVVNDPDTGYVTLTASYDNHATDVEYDGTAGTGVTVQSAAVRSLAVDGMSVQNGTPSPDNPIPIQVVKGINLLQTTATSGTINGVTFTVNQDGTVTANGTATADATFIVAGGQTSGSGLDIEIENGAIASLNVHGSSTTYMGVTWGQGGGQSAATFNDTRQLNAGFVLYGLGIRIKSGYTCNNLVFKPQLTAGSVPQPFVPYGALGLHVHSKNLLEPQATDTKNGVTLTANSDGSYTLDGAASSSTWFTLDMVPQLPAGTYTLSANNPTASEKASLLINVDGMFIAGAMTTVNKVRTVTAANKITQWAVVVATGETFNGFVIRPQLERGETDTEFVPYYSTMTPVPLSSNVLASLPDGKHDTLNIDSAGHVTIESRSMVDTIATIGTITTSGTTTYASVTPSDTSKRRNWANFAEYSAEGGGNNSTYCSKCPPNDLTDFYIQRTWNSIYIYAPASKGYTQDDFDQFVGAEIVTRNKTAVIDLGYITLPALADGATVDVVASLATSFTLVGYNGQVAATSISVSRVNPDGTSVMLLDHGASGSGILDKYAPLNTNYQYEVVTHAESTAIAVEYVDNFIETLRWFVYWGADYIAWAEWNPAGGYSLKRPQKKRVHYVGREYPVSYDGTALDEAHSVTFTVLDRDEWQNGFIQLMHDGGRGVYKSVDGKVFMADVEINNTPNYTSLTTIGTVALSITRIDSDAL